MSKSKGFTLVEILVALFIFSLVIGGAVNLLVSSLSAQKISLQKEQVFREQSSLAEYMGRAFRQATKELGSPALCLTTVGRGYNYELNSPTNNRIRFLDRNNICQQFFVSGSQIYEQKSTDSSAANFGAQVALTSNNATADSLLFALLGQNQTDNLQPRVTFFAQINGIQLQTTISQRNFDVQQ